MEREQREQRVGELLQVSGLTYTWDRDLAADPNTDALVGDVLFDADGNPATAGDNTPLVDTQTYRVVANNFLSDGGDNFATFKSGTNKLIGGLDIDWRAKYVTAREPAGVTPTPTDRIKSIN